MASPLGKLSKLDIINNALKLAKLPEISTLNDESDTYSMMYSQMYDTTLESTLMNTPYPFAQSSANLKSSMQKIGWYVLPSDFISILPPYKILEREGDYVKTNSSFIKYVRYLDSKSFPAIFTTLLTVTLASIYAYFRDNPQLGISLNAQAKVLLESFNRSTLDIPVMI